MKVGYDQWSHSKARKGRCCVLGLENGCTTNRAKPNKHGVYSSCAETAHATIVVEGGINAVDTNGVDSKLFEVRSITRAAGRECEGVYEAGRFAERVVSRLYNDTCETL